MMSNIVVGQESEITLLLGVMSFHYLGLNPLINHRERRSCITKQVEAKKKEIGG